MCFLLSEKWKCEDSEYSSRQKREKQVFDKLSEPTHLRMYK